MSRRFVMFFFSSFSFFFSSWDSGWFARVFFLGQLGGRPTDNCWGTASPRRKGAYSICYTPTAAQFRLLHPPLPGWVCLCLVSTTDDSRCGIIPPSPLLPSPSFSGFCFFLSIPFLSHQNLGLFFKSNIFISEDGKTLSFFF